MAASARLALVILAVEDVARAARFYASAFGRRQTVDAAPAYAEFAVPDDHVAAAAAPPAH